MRLRSIDKAFEEIKATDPGSAISKYWLRQLTRTRPDIFIQAGRRILIDLDRFEKYLTEPHVVKIIDPVAGRIRKIP